MPQQLNRQTLERLMQYYLCINRDFDPQGNQTIPSARLAQLLSLDGTQIRKDLAAIGVKGQCRVGFEISRVAEAIRKALGFENVFRAVIIGAGHLGGAIAAYEGFARYGLQVVALFDIDPGKIGLNVGHHVIQPLEKLEFVIKDRDVHLGIITVPADAAQECTDRMVKAGIKGIWNFSPVNLKIPPEIISRHEDLSVGLAYLSYHLTHNG